VAPRWVICALDLEAGTAAQAIVEQCCAKGSSVHAVALAVEVAVSTSSTCRECTLHELNSLIDSTILTMTESFSVFKMGFSKLDRRIQIYYTWVLMCS
jgi:hypothetical protein